MPAADFNSAYEKMLHRWPLAPETRDVQTATTKTRLHVWSPVDAPPLILLHGFKVTSTMWGPQAEALGRIRRVHAVDTIDDYGFSTAEKRPRTGADFASWLRELCDALDFTRVDVGGMSYGGWIAAHFAAQHPERVGKLMLFAPGGLFAPFSAAWGLYGLPMLVWRRRQFVAQYLRWASVPPANDPVYDGYMDGLADVMLAGHFAFPRFALPLPRGLPASKIAAPTLLLYGDHEKMHAPEPAIATARAAIAQLEAIVVPNASHNLTLSAPAIVNQHVVHFLT